MTVESTGTSKLLILAELMPCPETHRISTRYLHRHVGEFIDRLPGIPVPQGPGSISIVEAFWLYRLVAELQPSLIVESGSANGWSTFIMSLGAPGAEIVCFDPYNRPDALPENATYEERDWTTRRKWPSGTFALFDDHCNQRIRLRQAQAAGLRDVAFHDVYSTPSRSLLSLRYLDVLGLADRLHTFEPAWDEHPAFTDVSTNPQMYRWLTWVRVSQARPQSALRRAIARRRMRNPWAAAQSAANWTKG